MKLPQIKGKGLIFILVVLAGFLIIHIVQAVTAEPGTEGDPIVTQSYVDKQVSDLMVKIDELTVKNTELIKKSDELALKNTELVSKLEEVILKNTELSNAVNDINVKTEGLTGVFDDFNSRLQSAEKGTRFEILQVKTGQKLTAGASAEIIIRTGKAIAFINEGAGGGLSDVITGVDIKTGTIPNNHLLIVPKDDGRGFTASTDLWVMIKGTYVIQ